MHSDEESSFEWTQTGVLAKRTNHVQMLRHKNAACRSFTHNLSILQSEIHANLFSHCWTSFVQPWRFYWSATETSPPDFRQSVITGTIVKTIVRSLQRKANNIYHRLSPTSTGLSSASWKSMSFHRQQEAVHMFNVAPSLFPTNAFRGRSSSGQNPQTELSVNADAPLLWMQQKTRKPVNQRDAVRKMKISMI